jgi:subtilisin family serine protease
MASLNDLALRNNLRIVRTWPIQLTGKRIVKFRYRDARTLESVQAALLREPLIVSLQNNFYYERQSTADPSSEALPQYALDRISAVKAHEISEGSGSLVAIIDSGIDASHPDLKGQIVNMFDATESQSKLTDPHGTAVAGLVAANGLLLGVAPEARLLDVRVFDTLSDEDATVATSESLLRGLDWAVSQKANIINMSLTGPADPLLKEVMAAIAKRGIIVVAAAGNNGADAEPAYPAAYDDVIAVTATTSDDSAYEQANQGNYIDIAAPGVDLLVTSPDDTYRLETGTSFAAAEVTGVIALLLGQNSEMSREEIVSALERGALDIGQPGKDVQFGAGLVNALNSLNSLKLN